MGIQNDWMSILIASLSLPVRAYHAPSGAEISVDVSKEARPKPVALLNIFRPSTCHTVPFFMKFSVHLDVWNLH